MRTRGVLITLLDQISVMLIRSFNVAFGHRVSTDSESTHAAPVMAEVRTSIVYGHVRMRVPGEPTEHFPNLVCGLTSCANACAAIAH